MRIWATLALVTLTIGCRAAYVIPIRLAQAQTPIRSAEVELSAISLLEKGELGNVYHDPTGPTAHVSPLYPFILAGIYAVLPPYSLASMLLQSLLAMAAFAVTLALLPWLARRAVLTEWAGWLAAFVLAVLPINFYYESFGDWEQPLAGLVFVLLCGCFLELRAGAWENRALIVGTGMATGIAALLSPSLVPAAGMMILAELVWPTAPRRRILAGAAGVLGIAALMVAPWTIRNYHALGGFVPLRSNFGLELWFGNHDGATGSSNIDWSDPDMSEKMRHPHPNVDECRRLSNMGELAYMRSRQAEAVAWIGEHPGEFVRLTGTRARIFWFPGHESFNNHSVFTTIKIVGFGAISLLMFFSLARLAWSRHPSVALFAAALFGATFIYLITHVELRYRLPVHAVTGLLAAETLVVVAHALIVRLRRDPTATVCD
ncbi:MAG TPA: hypothetical protein VFE62_10110 [Gemmataceae bacterium]|nr:hypothetical protein [Gemmataceae bacterium]